MFNLGIVYSDSECQGPGEEMSAGIESCVVSHENPQDDHCVIVRKQSTHPPSIINLLQYKKAIIYFNIFRIIWAVVLYSTSWNCNNIYDPWSLKIY